MVIVTLLDLLHALVDRLPINLTRSHYAFQYVVLKLLLCNLVDLDNGYSVDSKNCSVVRELGSSAAI